MSQPPVPRHSHHHAPSRHSQAAHDAHRRAMDAHRHASDLHSSLHRPSILHRHGVPRHRPRSPIGRLFRFLVGLLVVVGIILVAREVLPTLLSGQ